MDAVSIMIPGKPCAKGRPRMAVVAGRARAYTDQRTRSYESLVCLEARAVSQHCMFYAKDPLRVIVCAVFPRPKCLLERSKVTGRLLRAVEGRMHHAVRPDADNVLKAVLDGINRSGIWHDDSRVVEVMVTKEYAAIGEDPHVLVLIDTLEATR